MNSEIQFPLSHVLFSCMRLNEIFYRSTISTSRPLLCYAKLAELLSFYDSIIPLALKHAIF
jgi:hypothetical protein